MCLDKYIYPHIGIININDIKPRFILEHVLRPLEEREILETARRVKSVINQVYLYGIASGQTEINSARCLQLTLNCKDPPETKVSGGPFFFKAFPACLSKISSLWLPEHPVLSERMKDPSSDPDPGAAGNSAGKPVLEACRFSTRCFQES